MTVMQRRRARLRPAAVGNQTMEPACCLSYDVALMGKTMPQIDGLTANMPTMDEHSCRVVGMNVPATKAASDRMGAMNTLAAGAAVLMPAE
jgi:hypothetical protein